MDKRGVKILICCIISTLIVLILFIVAFKFTQPSCELIFIEPALLGSSALAGWAKEKPIRSHDRTVLMKFAAHLEYNIQSTSSPSSSESQGDQTHATPAVNQMQASNQQQGQVTSLPGQINQQMPFVSNQQNLSQQNMSQQNLSNFAGRHPAPSIPQSGFTNQQLQNSSFSINQTQHVNREKRFLPLELTDLEVRKLDDNRSKYTLTFNCSSMTMILVRKFERVYFDQVNMELNLASKREYSCDLQWPNQQGNNTGLFGIEAQTSWAHYYCDRPLHYNCYHYSSKPNQPGILLAELHIHAIEFEIGMNSRAVHKKHEFLAPKKECDI